MANLWGGRFEKDMDGLVEQFNASIPFDRKMYASDIRGSIAHAAMLARQGIIPERDKDAIVAALEKIRRRIAAGEITFTAADEDVHMAVEGLLTRELGDAGKKLHTARSRNDQCAVDTRLHLRDGIRDILAALLRLEDVILAKAEQYADSLMIGFTHTQHAQPVTIGFHFMAYFQMFRRDAGRLLDARRRLNQCPLGACALAGTTFPIDRRLTSDLLGFSAPTENAMDSVSDRDYAIEFLAAAAISLTHVSRFAEEFVWWNSQEFGFIDIDDSYCTGSSIMPQKKNPDMAELLRGKGCRVYGHLMQMLALMKGTPLSYNKDFQEDKEGLFDAIETWEMSLRVMAGMIGKTEFRLDAIASHMGKGFLNATDIAENLARRGIPFRDAHELVGRMVRFCEKAGKDFSDLGAGELAEIDSRLTPDMLPDLSLAGCVRARKSFGGTAPEEVRRQINAGREWLDAAEKTLAEIS